MWSQGKQATRSNLSLAKRLSAEAAEATLGKREPPYLMTEQGKADSGTPSEGHCKNAVSTAMEFVEELVTGAVEEKLNEKIGWSGNLKIKVGRLGLLEEKEVEIPPPKEITKFILPRRVPEEVKTERKKPEPMIIEEEPIKEKPIVRRDHPFKIKGFTMDEVYYPEDFLIKGLFAANSKSGNRKYIDVRTELAYPLSQNIVLRNENTLELSDLDGRLFKYFDETKTIRTLQFAGGRGEERCFIDLENGGILE